MILSELMDKLGIPSQAKDIMDERALNAEIVVKHEHGKTLPLTGDLAFIGGKHREIIIWVEA